MVVVVVVFELITAPVLDVEEEEQPVQQTTHIAIQKIIQMKAPPDIGAKIQ